MARPRGHEHASERHGAGPGPVPAGARALEEEDAAASASSGVLTTANALSMQRLAGNRAVAGLVEQRRRNGAGPGDPAFVPLQRWSIGGALRQFGSWVSGLFSKGGDKGGQKAEEAKPPESTVAAEQPRGAVPKHPAPPRPGFDLAGGQEILTTAFGSVKKIVPGKIEVLEPAAFKAAYDKIYGAGEYSWDKYVVPKYGSLNGFAYDGVNYINKASAGLHTIVHEMLHNNTASDWRGVVGSRWDEGTTEVLTKIACAQFNEPAPTCYPGESPVVDEAIAQGLPKSDLIDAYLAGGAQKKVADWVDAHCTLSWAKVKQQMEAQNWAAAKAGLAPKKATPPANATATPLPATAGK
ncbi:MAG TPA: hypothetical protein VHN98_08810 [Acidimicrobiales bacterium]|nr:hypothetical protein [Acidimicrobiales bacterium]